MYLMASVHSHQCSALGDVNAMLNNPQIVLSSDMGEIAPYFNSFVPVLSVISQISIPKC